MAKCVIIFPKYSSLNTFLNQFGVNTLMSIKQLLMIVLLSCKLELNSYNKNIYIEYWMINHIFKMILYETG